MIPFIKETFICKGFFLIWASFEFAIIWNSYYRAYKTIKHSPIIDSLQWFFFWLTILFIVLFITPLLGVNDVYRATMFSNYVTWIFVIPVIFYANQFRVRSTEGNYVEMKWVTCLKNWIKKIKTCMKMI